MVTCRLVLLSVLLRSPQAAGCTAKHVCRAPRLRCPGGWQGRMQGWKVSGVCAMDVAGQTPCGALIAAGAVVAERSAVRP
eukprot:scaffold570_cov382-Prasinococcus_capsulatus_cf.AAC.12